MGLLTAIKLLTRLSSISPIRVANEREPLGSSTVSILGEENSSDMSEAREDIAEIVFFCEFGNLVKILSVMSPNRS